MSVGVDLAVVSWFGEGMSPDFGPGLLRAMFGKRLPRGARNLLPSHSWHFVQRSRAQRANSPTLAPTSTIKGASVLKLCTKQGTRMGLMQMNKNLQIDRIDGG
jgi:hypothetical protein